MYDPNNPMPWMQTPGMKLAQTLTPAMMRGAQGSPSIGGATGQQVMPQAQPIQQVETYRSPVQGGGQAGMAGQVHNGQSPFARQAPQAPQAPGAAPSAPDPTMQSISQFGGQMSKLMQQLQQQRSAQQAKAPNADPLAQTQADTPKAPMGLLGDTQAPATTPTAPTSQTNDFDPMKLFRGLLGGGSF